jgi:hypothetical protein
LVGSQLAQAYHFAILEGFHDDIIQCDEYGIHIGLGHGAGAQYAGCHFADVYVSTGLYLGIEFRCGFFVTGVDTRYDGVSY